MTQKSNISASNVKPEPKGNAPAGAPREASSPPSTGVTSTGVTSAGMTSTGVTSTGVTGRARAIADEARDAAGEVGARARGAAERQLASGKDRVGEGLAHLAEALRKTASNLRGGESNESRALTEYVTRAADRVEVASDYFGRRTLSEVIGDVEDFARREPAILLGGAFGAGLLAGRFLRSTRRPRETAKPGGAA